jgi:hypothetical protein
MLRILTAVCLGQISYTLYEVGLPKLGRSVAKKAGTIARPIIVQRLRTI